MSIRCPHLAAAPQSLYDDTTQATSITQSYKQHAIWMVILIDLCLPDNSAIPKNVPSALNPSPNRITRDPDSLDVWILGSGIAALTAAVYLIREARVPPSRIHIREAAS